MRNYLLIGQTPVPCDDLLEWAREFETADRRVAQTDVLDMCHVSTIFLGMDHSFGRRGAPLLFETMAFWRDDHAEEQMRCSTWIEAEKQHARMCAYVVRPRVILAYIGRWFRTWWKDAAYDARVRWRELRGIEPSTLDRMRQELQALLRG
jgi:hypothetical protein